MEFFVPSSPPDGFFSDSLPFRPHRVSWVKVDDDMPSHAVIIGADLYIENLNKSYNGTYRCTASNSVGESFDDYVLYVYGTSVPTYSRLLSAAFRQAERSNPAFQTPNGRELVWVLQQGATGSGLLCASSASFTLDQHVSGSCNADIFTGGFAHLLCGLGEVQSWRKCCCAASVSGSDLEQARSRLALMTAALASRTTITQ